MCVYVRVCVCTILSTMSVDVLGLECRLFPCYSTKPFLCVHTQHTQSTRKRITVDAVMMYAARWNNGYRLINEMLPMKTQR